MVPLFTRDAVWDGGALRPLRGHRRDLRFLRTVSAAEHHVGAALHDRADRRGRRRPRRTAQRQLVSLAALHGRGERGPAGRVAHGRATPTATEGRRTAWKFSEVLLDCRRSARSRRAGCGGRSGTTDEPVAAQTRHRGTAQARPRAGASRRPGRGGQRDAGRRRHLRSARLARGAGAGATDPVRGRARCRARRRSAEEDPSTRSSACAGSAPRAARESSPASGRIKDSVAIAGIPLTCGSRVLQGFVPEHDSVVTDRILRAGGEIVADHEHGRPRLLRRRRLELVRADANPFDGPDRRRLLGRLGRGTLLRRRRPRRRLRPGRLHPRAGLLVRSRRAQADALARALHGDCGHRPDLRPLRPAGRARRTSRALLEAIAGRTRSDPRQRDVPTRATTPRSVRRADDLSGVRIGVVAEGFSAEVGAEPATARAVRGRRRAARTASAPSRGDISLPEHLQAGGIAFAGFIEGMTALMGSGGNGIGWRGRYWEELAARPRGRPREPRAGALAADQDHAHRGRRSLRASTSAARSTRKAAEPQALAARAYDRALAEVDVLLLPDRAPSRRSGSTRPARDERVLRGWANLANTYPTDMTGHPAISLPLAAGRRPAGRRHARRAAHFDDRAARDRGHLRARARRGVPAIYRPSSDRRTRS